MLSHFLRAANVPVTGDLTVSYAASAQTNSANTTHTLSSIAIGAASKLRRIVVAVGTVGTNTGDTVNSVTVNGVALTKHVEDSGAVGVAIFSEVIPSGALGTVVVTLSASANIAIHVFRVISATSSYSGSSAVNSSTGTTVTTSNLTVTANDVGVFIASQQSGNAVSETASIGTLSESVDAVFTANAARRTAAGTVTYNGSSSTATVTLTGDSGILKRIALCVFKSP